MRRLFLFVGLFVSCLGAFAQVTTPDRQFPVSAVFDKGLEERTSWLDSIFLECLEIEFGLAGFEISDSADPAVLIRIAYTTSETFVQFSISAVVPEDGRILHEISSNEELSFNLDTMLLEHARQLAGFVKEYAETETESNEESIAVPVGEKATTEKKMSVSSSIPVNQHRAFPLQEARKVVPDWFVLGVDAGIFLAGGEAGRYFGGGYTLSTLVGYRFPYYPGIVLGASLGCMYFILDGYSAEARGLAVILGPGLRLEADDARNFVPGLRVNTGAALLMVFPENGELMTKVIPAAEVAMTIGIVLEKVTLNMHMGSKVFLEGSSILYGFAPGIGIEF